MNIGYELDEPSGDGDDPWPGFTWTLGEEYNIAGVIFSGPDDRQSRTALSHEPLDSEAITISYAELNRASDAVATTLRDRGIEPGDRVSICLPQCPETLIAHLAVFKTGATGVPLSMLVGTESFEYVLDHCRPSLLLVDEQRYHQVSPLSNPVDVVPVSVGQYDESSLGGLLEFATTGRSFDPVATAPSDPALIMYTSGTTGKPKGVVQGHRYLAGTLPGYQAWFELFDESDAAGARVWTPAEWAWAGALFDVVFPTLALGGCVISNERRTGFDPVTAISRMDRQRVSHAFMAATALRRIRSADVELSVPSLQVVMAGGEKLPGSLHEWAEANLVPRVHECYGQTEANALVGNCRRAFPVRPGSMGRPYPGHDVVVVDESGAPVDPGTVGEIAVRLPDPVVFLGYLDDEAATSEKFRGDLYLTGDLALRDDDGYLWHHGRKDELILTSGYRVSPLEVEEALEALNPVAEAVVGGVPDDQRGEIVKAVVKPRSRPESEAKLARSLRDAVGESLGRHKVPRDVEFVEEIPETRTGKTDRSIFFDGDDASG